jgi:hypothetical protein
MALTQHFRREGTVISAVSTFRYSCTITDAEVTPRHPRCLSSRRPNDLCPELDGMDTLPISFFLNRDDTVTVKVVDGEGNAVRTLAEDVRLRGNRRHCFPWDGRADDSQPAKRRRFRLLVVLRDADREAIAGEPIVLSSPAPAPGS